jgi:adenosine/AMP kinase
MEVEVLLAEEMSSLPSLADSQAVKLVMKIGASHGFNGWLVDGYWMNILYSQWI